jgi:hypothetical protein
VIVNFSVENDPDGTVFVADGLMASGKIDDAEAAHAEPNPALGEEAIVVGTAMGHHVAHTSQNARIDSCVCTEFKYSSNSTHFVFLPQLTSIPMWRLRARNLEIRNQ